MALAGFVSADACVTLEDGLKRATDWAKRTGGVPVVCGSLFLAGEALLALDAFPWPIRPPDANEMFPGHVS
jgi:hypothetical protein